MASLRTPTRALLALAVFALAACAAPAAAPTVSITSPSDGATITGSRTVTVTGSATNATSVTVDVDGSAAIDATLSGTIFTADVELGDRGNLIAATVTGLGGQASATIDVTYPFVALATNQAAAVVIGADTFTENPAGTASPSTLDRPYGRPYLGAGRLFVPDLFADQVLVFDTVPEANGAVADWFLGSADGMGGAASGVAGDLSGPQSIAEHDGRLYALEYSGSRIQVFDPTPSATGAVGDFVIGKADFADTATDCTPGLFESPEDAHIGGGHLVVSDSGHNRVLIYLSVPTAAGAVPDLVLGQADFTSCDSNRGGAVAADTLGFPAGIWTDGERLIVADGLNDRVLLWTAFPTVNGQPANVVLGQPDFTSDTAGVGAGAFDFPYHLDSNGNQLVVGDDNNYRFLVWNAIPTTSGTAADVVLGQVDADTAVARAPAGLPTARNFASASGALFGPDVLVTLDSGLSRALIFRAVP
ncbi:MAG: Ig-like domain-containing protein [Trueperaceae bacterium]